MNNLYYIENQGCDDTTCGLARISDDDFPKFKEMIENLNKNSYYGCMPTIQVWRVKESEIEEVVYDPDKYCGDGKYVSKSQLLYMDGKTYTFVKRSPAFSDMELVI